MSDEIHDDLDAMAGADVEVLYADPAWDYASNSVENPGRNARRHYRTMKPAEIEALPVKPILARDAVLFMWITSPFLAVGAHIPIMRAWGFQPSSLGFTWIKTRKTHAGAVESEADLFFGGGHTTRKNSEFVMIGKRGSSLRANASVREVVFHPVMEHSRKPLEVARRISTYVGPGRRMIEMFSRETSPGFLPLGNQVGMFDSAHAAMRAEILSSVAMGLC